MSNIDKQALTAKTKELSSLMVERFSMNPVSCKLLNEAWEKEFPDEVAIAKRMLALLDELEAKDRRMVEQVEIIAKQEKWINDVEETMISATDRAEAAEKRIAELEASHGNLREAMAGIHNTIKGGGAYTPLASILNASKRAFEESAAAAGKGE